MIQELYIDEIEYSILKNGDCISDGESEEYVVEIHKDYKVFSSDNLHDQQKVEIFLEWAEKLTPTELELRLKGSVKELKKEIEDLKEELLDANEEIRNLEYEIQDD